MYRWRGEGLGLVSKADYGLDPNGGGFHCDAMDGACVARQAIASDKYNRAAELDLSQTNFDTCMSNAALSVGQPNYDSIVSNCRQQYNIQATPDVPTLTYYTPGQPLSYTPGGIAIPPPQYGSYTPAGASPVTAVAARGGQFSFSTSRGSNAMKVGDTWLLSITGATPNTQVSVSGSMPGGSFNTAMGSTDSNGNYSKSGTVGAGEIGSWSESWSVGSAASGSVSFTVSAATAAGAGSGGGAGAGSGSGSGDGRSGGAESGGGAIGFDFHSIPWWGWAAGAGVAVMAFGGGGRGR